MMGQAMERWIVEYVVNCAWQIPLLAAGAWMLVKAMRPGVLTQHCLWLSVLAMAVVLPGRGIDWPETAQNEVREPSAIESERFVGTLDPKTSLVVAASFREARSGDDVSESLLDSAGSRRRRRIHLGIAATQWLVRIYFATVLFGAARFLEALFAARRLVKESREVTLGAETMRLFEALGKRLGVKRPCLRESDGVAGPVVVGVLRPVLLTPENFAAHADEEISAALCHELAHVRRRDYLVNLVCQVAALPVAWHPAVYAVQARIRRTREMVCDAIAAEEMESGAGYARCLVSLAQQMVSVANASSESQAMGLFENGTIEERVMKLTETKAQVSGRTRVLRGVCGSAAMLLVMGAATTFHVRPTFAETASLQASSAPAASPQTAATPTPAPPANAAPLAKPSAEVLEDDDPVMIESDDTKVIAKDGKHVHRWKAADGKSFTVVDDDVAELSDEDKLKLEQEVADAKVKADDATRWVNGPEFKKQMAEMQKTINSAAMKEQMEAAKRIANDPTMKLQMDEMRKQLAHMDIQLDATRDMKIVNDVELQKELADVKVDPQDFKMKFDFDKQMEIANSIKGMKLDEQIANSMKISQQQMAKMQKEIESGELQRRLDEARRQLDEAQRQLDEMKKKK